MNRPDRSKRPNRPDGVIGLLAEILRGLPRLDNAACRGRHVVWDCEQTDHDEREYTQRSAIEQCKKCPALAACREWAAAQTNLTGVVAGEVQYFHGAKRSA